MNTLNRRGIPAKAVFLNNCNTGKTAQSWSDVPAAVADFADDLYGHLAPLGINAGARRMFAIDRLFSSLGIQEPKLWMLTPTNSVETPKSFTVQTTATRIKHIEPVPPPVNVKAGAMPPAVAANKAPF